MHTRNDDRDLVRELADYIGGLVLCQGRYAGRPFRLLPWQRRFLAGAFGQPDDAAVSLARGGGKTTFTAAIATAALNGPLVEPMAESVIAAASFEQALIPFRHALAFLAPAIEREPRRWRVQDSVNRASITDRQTGAMLRVIGAKPGSMHGLAPKLLLLDELAQWPTTTVDAALAALQTSRGKIPGSRALWLGTRPSSPEHPFEVALRGGVGYAQVHAARPDDPRFRRATWKRANPGLDALPDLEAVIRQEAARARRDPAALASFEALRLNLGVADTVEAVLLSAGTWAGIEADDAPGRGQGGPYVLGLDLGTSAAQSAACAFWPASGALDAFACFPELPTLAERGLADGVGRLYTDCFRRGELVMAGRRVSDIGALLREALGRWGVPAVIVADRYREAELREKLEAVGFPLVGLELRGQGFRDGAEDVRRFRAACLDGKVRPRRSLLLRSAMGEARVVSDPSGNAKLAKASQGGRRARARDDAAAAAILAVASGTRGPTVAPVAAPRMVAL